MVMYTKNKASIMTESLKLYLLLIVTIHVGVSNLYPKSRNPVVNFIGPPSEAPPDELNKETTAISEYREGVRQDTKRLVRSLQDGEREDYESEEDETATVDDTQDSEDEPDDNAWASRESSRNSHGAIPINENGYFEKDRPIEKTINKQKDYWRNLDDPDDEDEVRPMHRQYPLEHERRNEHKIKKPVFNDRRGEGDIFPDEDDDDDLPKGGSADEYSSVLRGIWWIVVFIQLAVIILLILWLFYMCYWKRKVEESVKSSSSYDSRNTTDTKSETDSRSH